ncbi:MAG: hypothetical protein PPP58_05280 [Natronomonas sp.]
MNGTCYFCNGIVSAQERGDFHLRDHGDHEVFLHRRCAVGYDLIIERTTTARTEFEIECPECGTIEVQRRRRRTVSGGDSRSADRR